MRVILLIISQICTSINDQSGFKNKLEKEEEEEEEKEEEVNRVLENSWIKSHLFMDRDRHMLFYVPIHIGIHQNMNTQITIIHRHTYVQIQSILQRQSEIKILKNKWKKRRKRKEEGWWHN